MTIVVLRRKINEPTGSVYSDAVLSGYLVDSGNDENAVASEIWYEKAAALQPKYDFRTEGESYSVNQAYENALKLARYYASKRKATTSFWTKDPVEVSGILFSLDTDDFEYWDV
jgi:hypothetical protein